MLSGEGWPGVGPGEAPTRGRRRTLKHGKPGAHRPREELTWRDPVTSSLQRENLTETHVNNTAAPKENSDSAGSVNIKYT